MNDIRTIGFVGLGNMGVPMAANLVRAGYDVVAFDIDTPRAQKFAHEHAARATSDLAELGKSADAVITMLPTGHDVHDVVFHAQDGALVTSLRAGSIVIDMSSAEPVGTRDLGKKLSARNIALIDAPVSGGVLRAKDGTLAIMIGGNADAIAAAKPLLSKLGQKLFEVGDLGCGHAMKALNNFLAAANFAAAAEAIAVGRRFGLDPAVMVDVINVSTGRSFASENLMKQHVLSETFGTGFALGLLAKDAGIAADLARQIGSRAPIGRMICDMLIDASGALGGNQDHTRAASYWAKIAARRAAE